MVSGAVEIVPIFFPPVRTGPIINLYVERKYLTCYLFTNPYVERMRFTSGSWSGPWAWDCAGARSSEKCQKKKVLGYFIKFSTKQKFLKLSIIVGANSIPLRSP